MSYKWESEKIAQLRLKSRHGGLDENERLLYEDYLQSCALTEANVTASEARSMGRMSERQLKKSAMRRGVVSLALVAMFGMYAMTGCKLSESIALVPYTAYEISYKLTGELPDTNKALSNIANMAKVRSSIPMPVSSDDCFFNEVVSRLRGTSDRTEVQRHIRSDEALRNYEVYSQQQQEDSSDDPGTYVPDDGGGYDGHQPIEDFFHGDNGGKRTIEDLGNG